MSTLKELLTVDRFIEWLKTKPPEEKYQYSQSRAIPVLNHKGCALVQFVHENGFKGASVDAFNVNYDGRLTSLPHKLDVISSTGSTFGGALKAAYAMKAKETWGAF